MKIGHNIRPLTKRDMLSDHEARMALPLAPREVRVYEILIETGWSNKKIAAKMGTSEGTIKVYMSHIIRVYEAEDRTELIARALWGKIRGLEADLRNVQKQESAA